MGVEIEVDSTFRYQKKLEDRERLFVAKSNTSQPLRCCKMMQSKKGHWLAHDSLLQRYLVKSLNKPIDQKCRRRPGCLEMIARSFREDTALILDIAMSMISIRVEVILTSVATEHSACGFNVNT